MIVVIEGPDRVGKTTLFNAMHGDFVKVPAVPMVPELMPVIELLEERTMALWEALYDPTRTYLVDRGPFISNVVYALVYGRKPKAYPKWIPRIRYIYLRASAWELEQRPKDIIPQDYERVLAAYGEVLPKYRGGILLTEFTLAMQIAYATEWINHWRLEWATGTTVKV